MGSDSFKDHLGSRWEDCVTGNGLLRSYLGTKWNYAKGADNKKRKGDCQRHPVPFVQKGVF